jgi:hypothetical protein
LTGNERQELKTSKKEVMNNEKLVRKLEENEKSVDVQISKLLKEKQLIQTFLTKHKNQVNIRWRLFSRNLEKKLEEAVRKQNELEKKESF